MLGKCYLESPYKSDNEGQKAPEAGDAMKTLNAVAWVLHYASTVGDYLPNDNVVVTPRREKHDMWLEYKSEMESSNSNRSSLSYSAFCKLLKHNKDLEHIKVSKLNANFERCSTCKNLDEQIRSALKAGQFQKVEQIKQQRKEHVAASRGERLYYYNRQTGDGCKRAMHLHHFRQVGPEEGFGALVCVSCQRSAHAR